MSHEWTPDPNWTVGGHGRNCRFPRCGAPAVAALSRKHGQGRQWYYYCPEHLYGRRIINGLVCQRRRASADTDDRQPTATADAQRLDWLEAQRACNIDRMGTDAPYWRVYGERGSGACPRLRDAIDDAMNDEAERASADTGERA
jgi:hypothetical protein